MEDLMKQLSQAVKDLNETITAKFSSANPAQVNAEKDALVEKVHGMQQQIDELNKAKAVKKMVWGVTGKESEVGAERIGFNRFLKAVAEKDKAFLDQVESKAPSGQSVGTAADGGNVVPVEYAAEIVALERQSSIARQLARIFPMGSLTRKVPRELAKPTVYWVNEGTEPAAASKGTLAQITQTAKKLMAIVPFTEELLEDNNTGFDAFIAEVVSQEMGREEDKMAFVGDATDAFKGVFFETGVNSVSLGGANLAYADLVDLLMAPQAPYRDRGIFLLSTTALKKVMKLVDDENRPIWTMPAAGNPGSILGKQYRESDQIPDTLGTERDNGTNTAILFGAWDQLWISPRGGYTVKASDSASGFSTQSAFTMDEIWFKFRRRQDITVANPEAFGKLAFPAA